MASSRAVAGRHREVVPTRILGGDLAAVLYSALREAANLLDAAAAAVCLLDEDGGELKAAMVGGSPPPVFMLPGHMARCAPGAWRRCRRTFSSSSPRS